MGEKSIHFRLRANKGNRSATMVASLWLTLGCFSLAAIITLQAHPAWWDTQTAVHPQVVTTNNGVVTTNYAPNPYAVANQGQLKQFTAAAVRELNNDYAASGGAGSTLTNLVYGWQQDYATNGYATNTANPTKPYQASDLQAVNVGQLKYIGNKVWSRLVTLGYTNAVPTWLAQNTDTDKTAANLGELKSVFNFNISAQNGAAAPTFSPAGGTYASSQTATLSSTTTGATIYYTTNGTAPTTSSSSVG